MSNCSICLQDCPRVDAYYLTCGHYYHFKCIYQWSKSYKTCPECRDALDHLKLNRDANKFGVELSQAPLAHPVEHKQPLLEHAIEVKQNVDLTFDEIYNSSVKPREDEALWKRNAYKIYAESNYSGQFNFGDRIRFIEAISTFDFDLLFSPGIVSLVNLVSKDFYYENECKWMCIFFNMLHKLANIYLWIGIVITVYLTTDKISDKFLICWTSIFSALLVSVELCLIVNYRYYGIKWLDYVRAKFMIAMHAPIFNILSI